MSRFFIWFTILFFINVSVYGFTNTTENHIGFEWIIFTPNNSKNIMAGIEYAELMQRQFKNIGPFNWSLNLGVSGLFNPGSLGLNLLAFRVDLSDDHLQNSNQVAFLEGDRTTITGDVSAVRLYAEWIPVHIRIGNFGKKQRYSVLDIQPILFTGPGWNSWGFREIAGPGDYRLQAMTWTVGAKIRTVLFNYVYIENPLFDAFVYLWKNRQVQGHVGVVDITRPEGFGIFSWATIGVQFSF